MKIQPTSPTPQLNELRQQSSVHDAGFETLKLQRNREIYAALYQRMQDALRLDDEGDYEVSITLRGPSRALTLTPAEAKACFSLTEIYGPLAGRLNALQNEILDTRLKVENGTPLDKTEGTDDPRQAQALALCLPPVALPAGAQPTPPIPLV